MDIENGYRFIGQFPALENKIILRHPAFFYVFLQEVQGNVRKGDDAEFGMFFGSLLVILCPGPVHDERLLIKEDLLGADSARFSYAEPSRKTAQIKQV
jgi:hypothetical protein